MPISIRNPRVEELARDLAEKRNTTMTKAIIKALENDLNQFVDKRPLRDQLKELSDRLKAKGKPGGHRMTKDEIDRMWGHE